MSARLTGIQLEVTAVGPHNARLTTEVLEVLGPPPPAIPPAPEVGTKIIAEAGVLRLCNTPIAATVGGFGFSPGQELRGIPWDGKRCEVIGLQLVKSRAPALQGTILEMSNDNHLTNTIDLGKNTSVLPAIEPGLTFSVAGDGSIVITPLVAPHVIAAGIYLVDLNLLAQFIDGTYVLVHFPIALCTKYEIVRKDDDEGHINARFEAISPDLRDPGYRIIKGPNIPTFACAGYQPPTLP